MTQGKKSIDLSFRTKIDQMLREAETWGDGKRGDDKCEDDDDNEKVGFNYQLMIENLLLSEPQPSITADSWSEIFEEFEEQEYQAMRDALLAAAARTQVRLSGEAP